MATLVASANLVVAQAQVPVADAVNENKCRTVFGSLPADYTTFGLTVFDFSTNEAAVAFTATKDQKTLIIGSSFNDTLVNDQGSDAVICGKKGDDSLVVYDGPTTVKGGGGRDALYFNGFAAAEGHGGPGDDFILDNQSTQDTMIGGAGSDSMEIHGAASKGYRIFGDQQTGKQLRPNSPGNATVLGTFGNDTLDTFLGIDSCDGNPRDDLIQNCEII